LLVYLIATLIAYLIILSILSTNTTHGNLFKLKRQTTEVKFNFKKEKIIKDALEYFCINNSDTCKNKKDDQGNILLTLSDISSEMPSDFDLNSSLGGNIEDTFYILPSQNKIEFFLNIKDPTVRYFYLHNYQGREFGLKPLCNETEADKTEDTHPPCKTDLVYHDYPMSTNLKDALK